eukprot:TRINITY_DN1746_c0_g1_i1.p1 TRINITY_DN1746_c0_g1~~TRINITY_DN1746_c0_g1_i1.p1  ORF type:complete len:160 (-),score=44.29 TRINITY_DN1746_c0_g1_i1:29-508(-)
MSEEAKAAAIRAELAAGSGTGEVALTLQNICGHPIAIYTIAQFPFWNAGIGFRPFKVQEEKTAIKPPIDDQLDMCAKPGFSYDALCFQVLQAGESISFSFELGSKYKFQRNLNYAVEWDADHLKGIRGFDNLNDAAWNKSSITNLPVDTSACKAVITFP